MSIRKISDLKPAFNGDKVTEWQSPAGKRYSYERDRYAVGQGINHGMRHTAGKYWITTTLPMPNVSYLGQ